MKKILLTAAFGAAYLFTSAQNVTIPDTNFKSALLAMPGINTNSDGEIQVTEATAYTGGISAISSGIANVTGLEAFTGLTSLNLNNNAITSLDISANTALTYLDCGYNQLTSLNVSANTALTQLSCNSNQITSLDVSMLTGLTWLEAGPNNLTTLDVSANTQLTYLHCVWNQLTSLDVSNNPLITDLSTGSNPITSLDVSMLTGLTSLNCQDNQLTSLNAKNGNNANVTFFFVVGNLNLYCIEVDNPTYSNGATQWYKEPFAFYSSTGCAPSALFTVNSSTICEGFTTFCNDMSANVPTAWNWNFGDGNTSTVQNPTHVYATAGVYTITQIVSNSGGSDTAIQVVTVNANPSVTLSYTDVTCNGACDGSLTASVTGASPFIYSWSNSATTSSVNGLCPGGYSVIITDINGCGASAATSVAQPAQISNTFSPTSSTCGASNGSISSSPTGGTGAFTFLWANGNVGNTLSGIPAGQYFLQLTDAAGCVAAFTGTVDDSNGPTVSLNSATNVSCYGLSDGAISTTISGGTAPLTIQWITGGNTSNLSNIPAGVYDLTVTDNSGCVVYKTYTVTEPGMIALNGSFAAPSACLNTDGSASVSVAGGTAPYTYAWDAAAAAQTTATATALAAGAYKVIVTDVNGCADSSYISVEDPGAPVIVIDSIVQAGCVSAGNVGGGGIYISVNGGSGSYSYNWTNGTTNQNATGLGKGIYGAVVTDNSTGCKAGVAKYIYGIQPGTPQICLVSVDTSNNHNIIIWENNIAGIQTYQVYRQSSVAGQFNLIATIPADSLSQYEDTLANAGIQPWNYEIRVKDSCNFVSVLSLSHQSIFLTVAANGGTVDLSWTPYAGTIFSDYYILRKGTLSPWTVVDSVPAGTTSYSDLNVPTDTLDYMIEIKPANPCDPSRAVINTSRSNIKVQGVNNPTAAVEENELTGLVNVYPNPVKDMMQVAVKAVKEGQLLISIYDVQGKEVFSSSKTISAGTSTETVPTKNLAEGLYVVQVSFNGKTLHKKIVKH
jgi:PKD repeat protein